MVRSALELAVLAPSIHNTQPWRWRIGAGSLHLYADATRWLPATDPDVRDLLVSCGAALHHARIALAALGWSGPVKRMSDPAAPEHLATIELYSHRPSDAELTMAAAIPHRRADRRRYAGWPVPARRLREFTASAAAEDVVLLAATEPAMRAGICAAIREADRLQRADYAYAAELSWWSGRTITPDGVIVASAGDAASYGGLKMRSFIGTPAVAADGGAGALLVLGTASDEAESCLRAGEAASAVMLAATAAGLATCPLSQPLEIGPTRALVAELLGSGLHPHLLIRMGWPTLAGRPLPRTPRRPLDDLIDPIS